MPASPCHIPAHPKSLPHLQIAQLSERKLPPLAHMHSHMTTSIYPPQFLLSKVQSGTFAVIYELVDARPEDMQIQPMIKNLRKSSPLKLADCRPSITSLRSYAAQSAVTIAQILMKYVPGFDTQKQYFTLPHMFRRNLLDSSGLVWSPGMSHIVTWGVCWNPPESARVKS